jgi:glucose repression regulatory protein TUP1
MTCRVCCCVCFSADGRFIATGCNLSAQIYDVTTGAKTCVLVDDAAEDRDGDLYTRSVCFSPDGKLLATGAEHKLIRIWDIAKRRIRNVFDGHQQDVYSVDFSPDGRFISSGSGDGTARIWDMDSGESKALTIDRQEGSNLDEACTSLSVKFNRNRTLVAAGFLSHVARIFDVGTGQVVEQLQGHQDSVYSVAFTPDGKGLVTASLDKTLRYWDKTEPKNMGGRCSMNFVGHQLFALTVAVSHDWQWVMSGSKDCGVHFWDSRNATVPCRLEGHMNSGGSSSLVCFIVRRKEVIDKQPQSSQLLPAQ